MRWSCFFGILILGNEFLEPAEKLLSGSVLLDLWVGFNRVRSL